MKKHESSGTIQLEISDSFIKAWKERKQRSKGGLCLRFAGVLCTAVSSLLLAWRANVDGKLSFYGILLRILSFVIMSFIFIVDDRFDLTERCLYSAPKVLGMVMAGVQLYGIVANEGGNVWTSV